MGARLTASDDNGSAKEFARETQVRDVFATRLNEFRSNERFLGTEPTFSGWKKRADMKTVDSENRLRIYEFKLVADTAAIGQLLGYITLGRIATDFKRDVIGVLAAFRFEPEVVMTVRVMNLGVELYELPLVLAGAGDLPPNHTQMPPLPKFDGYT